LLSEAEKHSPSSKWASIVDESLSQSIIFKVSENDEEEEPEFL